MAFLIILITNLKKDFGVSVQVSGFRKSEVGMQPPARRGLRPGGMREIRKGSGRVHTIESDFFRTRTRARPRESVFY